MATQITVTVPDDLRERMRKHTGAFNISRVCAEAIEKRLEEIELNDERYRKVRDWKESIAEML